MILTAQLPAEVIESLSADDIRWLEHEVSRRMEEEFKRIFVADSDAAAEPK
jgi:hypothetical protein